MDKNSILSGSCSCGEVRYKLRNLPLFVHACHCTDCQKKSGSAFGITIIILESNLIFDQGKPVSEPTTARRMSFFCESCSDVIYRTSANHPATALLRSRTLNDLRDIEINAHIWTKEKHTWLELPCHVPQFAEGYDRSNTWPQESQERLYRELKKVT